MSFLDRCLYRTWLASAAGEVADMSHIRHYSNINLVLIEIELMINNLLIFTMRHACVLVSFLDRCLYRTWLARAAGDMSHRGH